jgi:kynurenine formamidase
MSERQLGAIMRQIIPAIVGLCLFGCSVSEKGPSSLVPVPKQIVDLGTLITEETPERFWGKGFFNEMGYKESNSFDIINWDFGPVSGSNSYFHLFNHGGPHIDAPSHVGLGQALDSYSIDSFSGPLRVFDFSHLDIGRTITIEMVSGLRISSGDVVIIHTGYTVPAAVSGWPEAVALTYEAAEYLADIPVRAIGTDAYNVESMTDQSPVNTENAVAKIIPGHYAFLSRGIPVYEQLVNVDSLLDETNMYFVGVPLNVKGGDGMLVRPVVFVY